MASIPGARGSLSGGPWFDVAPGLTYREGSNWSSPGTGASDGMTSRDDAGERAGRLGAWQRARDHAHQTPAGRDRYIDLLRALSIIVVVIGHWLMAAPTVESGLRFTLSDMLRVAPWTQWLTWIFQVMPIFFVVGGYANAASWESARRSGLGYEAWLSRRLQRLVRPVLPFLLAWCALGLAARSFGLGREFVRAGSQLAFLPTWFLAVYVLVVVLAPTMHSSWRRFGMASFWALVLGAAVVDAVSRSSGVDAVLGINYVFVWLALHQLGFAWRDDTLSEPIRAASFALGGLAGLVVLVGLASYPVSMVTVPGGTAANSTPPSLALLLLGVTHVGLAMLIAGPVRRLLQRPAVWTATVFINGVIMTLYLWHVTVMILLVGIAEWPGGVGLKFVPNTTAWWATRPVWLLVLLVVTAGFVWVFGPVEAQPVRRTVRPPAWRSVVGAVAVCVGLLALAESGIGGQGALGLRLGPVLLTLCGALLVTVMGGRQDDRASAEEPSREAFGR
ncbi:MAG: acyltransferase [Gemmatimonadota bacterium]|nr:acyltransferase [Gemmatimonadota bacterium]